MHKSLFDVLKKADVCQPFFSLLSISQWLVTVIFCLLPVSTILANDDCDNLTEDTNWQQTVSGLNGWDTWMGNNIKNYSFDLEESCYCPEQAVVRISICEGSVFSVKNLETEETTVDPTQLMKYHSIAGYFVLIQKFHSQHPDEIRVKLNRSLGYPEEIWINPSYKTGDDEINLRISNVVPLRHD